MKLAEIATRIAAHLKRFEDNPSINARNKHDVTPYYCARACVAGNRVAVVYVSYQGSKCLTKADALAYLKWLDAGNVGRHWDAQRAARERA